MNPTVESVYQSAMQLSEDERVDLLLRLEDSLGGFASPEIAQAWAEEAERRLDQIDRGDTELSDADDVMRRLRDGFGK